MRNGLTLIMVAVAATAFGASFAPRGTEAGAATATDRALLRELRAISRHTDRMEFTLTRIKGQLEGSAPLSPGAPVSAGDALARIEARLNANGVFDKFGRGLAELVADVCDNTRPDSGASARC